MSVEIIIKIAALGVVVALLNQVLKHVGSEALHSERQALRDRINELEGEQ